MSVSLCSDAFTLLLLLHCCAVKLYRGTEPSQATLVALCPVLLGVCLNRTNFLIEFQNYTVFAVDMFSDLPAPQSCSKYVRFIQHVCRQFLYDV